MNYGYRVIVCVDAKKCAQHDSSITEYSCARSDVRGKQSRLRKESDLIRPF